MFIENMDIQKISYVLTHYVYRDTNVVENEHSKEIETSLEFYRKVHRVVAKNLNNARKFYPVLRELKSEAEIIPLAHSTMSPYEAKEFSIFVVKFYFLKNSKGWDLAEEVEEPIPRSAADFLLDGQFRAVCEEGCVLDNPTMYRINKDVNDRMFTLLKRGYFS